MLFDLALLSKPVDGPLIDVEFAIDSRPVGGCEGVGGDVVLGGDVAHDSVDVAGGVVVRAAGVMPCLKHVGDELGQMVSETRLRGLCEAGFGGARHCNRGA